MGYYGTFILAILLIIIILSLHSVRRAVQAQHETLRGIRNRITPTDLRVIDDDI